MERSTEPALTASPWRQAELLRLNDYFRQRAPEQLLTWAADQFGGDLVLTCSFGGPTGMVLLDMVVRLGRSTPVVFLDTGLLFPETYAVAQAAARRYGIDLLRQEPAISLEQQERSEGPQLYARDPDRCCAIRKVKPLAQVLQGYEAWISGLRRDQSKSRAGVDLLQWSERYGMLKLNPLAYWSARDVWGYIYRHDLPYNPLLNQGYHSLGCMPCTHPSSDSDPRSGRWAGFAKTECGIHL